MMWALVLKGLESHINNGDNAMKYKDKVLKSGSPKDEGKINIILRGVFSENSVERKEEIKSKKHWDKLLPKFKNEMSNYLNDKFKNHIIPNFTTNTNKDIIVFCAMVMGICKNYFSYICQTRCGMIGINLKGTKKDWETFYNSLEFLDNFDLNKWRNSLQSCLKYIINSYDKPKSKETKLFWSSMYKKGYRDGSGSGSWTGPYIQGWIVKWFLYKSNDRINYSALNSKSLDECDISGYGLFRTDLIPSGVVSGINIRIETPSGILLHDLDLAAGFSYPNISKNLKNIEPNLDYSIFEK